MRIDRSPGDQRESGAQVLGSSETQSSSFEWSSCSLGRDGTLEWDISSHQELKKTRLQEPWDFLLQEYVSNEVFLLNVAFIICFLSSGHE